MIARVNINLMVVVVVVVVVGGVVVVVVVVVIVGSVGAGVSSGCVFVVVVRARMVT